MKKVLVVIDYQNDFVDGALGFDGAETLEPKLLEKIEQTLDEQGFVLFTRDTHNEDYLQTREGEYLPVVHCVAGTKGHQLYGGLHFYEKTPTKSTLIIDKLTFGSPTIGSAVSSLCGGTPDIIELCGLVTDICVISNAILLHSFFPSTKIVVIRDLCGSGNSPNAENALNILQGLGIIVQ